MLIGDFLDCRGRWKTMQGWRSYQCTIGTTLFPFLIVLIYNSYSVFSHGKKEYV